jgi:hypothetical protein
MTIKISIDGGGAPDTFAFGDVWVALKELRWLRYPDRGDFTAVLQQAWQNQRTGEVRWEDVPTVITDEPRVQR